MRVADRGMQASLLQPDAAPLQDRLGDAGRILVTVNAADLPQFGDLFGSLLASPVATGLICVAVGPPADPGQLVVPSVLGAPASAVIWVGDKFGTDWALSSAARARPDGGPDGLLQLTEVLSSPAVFDQVLMLLSQVRGSVACPGLRLVKLENDEEAFAVGLARAIRQLAPPETRDASGYPAPFDEVQERRSGVERLSAGGKLLLARKRSAAAAGEAESALAKLASVAALLGRGLGLQETREIVAWAGETLVRVRERVVRLISEGGSGYPLTDRQRELWHSEGVSLASSEERLPGGTVAAVADTIASSLWSGDDLATVRGRLVATERFLLPTGTGTYLQDLDQRCPPSLAGRLRHPLPFPRPQAWLPVAGLVAAALSGVQSLVAGVILALAWTAMIVADSRRTSDAMSAARLPLAANVAGAVVGVLAGRGIAMALKPSGLVMLTAIVLATVIAAAAVTQSWRSRVGNWRRTLSPGEAAAAASAMTGLAAEMADRISSADYWREALPMTRIAIDGIREGISRCADDMETLAGHEDLADHGARLATALKPSVVDLVLAVLRAAYAEGDWRTADGQAIYRAAEAKASELVHLWIEHVKDRGLLEPPPFAREPHLSPADVLPAGPEDAIRSAVNSDPREVMWQLCRPGDLSIVDSDGPLPTVSFAPRDVQQVLAGEVPAQVIWTPPGKYAGLIRL